MIREFCQKNNIFYLGFLVGELPQIPKDVLIYANKTRPKELLETIIHKPVFELHEYLTEVSKEMNNESKKDINLVLYS